MADTAANFFALLLLGFFLLVRHATDADHVRTTTIMPVTERHWRCSTAVGSAACRLQHRLRQWRSVHRQSEWATTPIGRAVQLRATWLILDLPSLEPGATFYGVTVWAKWIIDRVKTCGIRFAEKATNRSPRR